MKPLPTDLADTYDFGRPTRQSDERLRVLVATITHHPDAARVGDEAVLAELSDGRRASVSRLEPYFGPPRGDHAPAALGTRHLSRKPVELTLTAGRLHVLNHTGGPVLIGGRPAGGAAALDRDDLERGVSLVLGDHVVLWLEAGHVRQPPRCPNLGFVGESEAIAWLRRELGKIADLEVPVLVRGETGTGKELVAQALHAHGRRASGPFVAVNVAAIPAAMVAGELFGHKRGAFTGADRDRPGLFESAHGGTLFLDEIGDISAEVQVALLRVLETGQVQKVGAGSPKTVDVRVVAATDADLEARVAGGTFRDSLFHRLSRHVVCVPSLRERRVDIPRLFFHYLRRALTTTGEQARLGDSADPWLPSELIVELLDHDWPGNVRELRHFAERLAIANRGEAQFVSLAARPTPHAVPRVPASATASKELDPSAPMPRSGGPTDDDVLSALEAHGWAVRPAARALGMAPNTLYERKARLVRPATALSRADIEDALATAGGDEARAAAALCVSLRALRTRRRDLDS